MKSTTVTPINTKFNTIDTICSAAGVDEVKNYIAACDIFEIQASQFASNENFFARKCAEEVSISYNQLKRADCAYSAYRLAFACEKWLEKAWNNAD